MDLGNAIVKIRLQKGIKQNKLAEECKISQTYLSQIENNKRDPNISTLKTISDALGIPLPLLFFSSITEADIPSAKKEAYNMVEPFIKSLVEKILV